MRTFGMFILKSLLKKKKVHTYTYMHSYTHIHTHTHFIDPVSVLWLDMNNVKRNMIDHICTKDNSYAKHISQQ